ncbi:hypothetical protein PROFUN_11719 [Planoprotostelium fungivorum]|uniref:Uncharacterized protein n=1 Tax=Planoprotostelium fungivorum TaxID=1890364 RepID=A0A2P6N958_9EUKA|nr:hypothetical protein PROFUN_11719 [Planoprotostelium fungivorum]
MTTKAGTNITSKEGRDLCWKARDEYHACLDANEENNALCQDKFKVYETVCTPTWLKHFEAQRKQKRLLRRVTEEVELAVSTDKGRGSR